MNKIAALFVTLVMSFGLLVAAKPADALIVPVRPIPTPKYKTGVHDDGCFRHWALYACDLVVHHGTVRRFAKPIADKWGNLGPFIVGAAIAGLCALVPGPNVIPWACGVAAGLQYAWFADEMMYAYKNLRCYRLRVYYAPMVPVPVGATHATYPGGKDGCKIYA